MNSFTCKHFEIKSLISVAYLCEVQDNLNWVLSAAGARLSYHLLWRLASPRHKMNQAKSSQLIYQTGLPSTDISHPPLP